MRSNACAEKRVKWPEKAAFFGLDPAKDGTYCPRA
jgi:hypothetical protein